jgi:hypothetical protein
MCGFICGDLLNTSVTLAGAAADFIPDFMTEKTCVRIAILGDLHSMGHCSTSKNTFVAVLFIEPVEKPSEN